jgi:Holliday junction resolvasome RuvABC endonuclease subunit
LRLIGIDPSSKICGIAVIDTPDTIVKVAHWKRDIKKSHPQGFVDWYQWLGWCLMRFEPQMAVIEMLSVERNANSAKAVAYYQAISALCCKQRGLVVIESRVSSARKAALGNGGLSKDEAWEIMRKRYPDLFAPKAQGGTDEMDALVLALAGPTVVER